MGKAQRAKGNYMGIDPGANGAAVVIKPDNEVDVCKFKGLTDYDISRWFREYSFDLNRKTFAYIENVHSMPGQGVASSFKFGKSYGFLLGLLNAFSIPFDMGSPVKWQNYMRCRTGGDKNITKAAAQRLYPNIKITHAIADALLIAEYCKCNK